MGNKAPSGKRADALATLFAKHDVLIREPLDDVFVIGENHFNLSQKSYRSVVDFVTKHCDDIPLVHLFVEGSVGHRRLIGSDKEPAEGAGSTPRDVRISETNVLGLRRSLVQKSVGACADRLRVHLFDMRDPLFCTMFFDIYDYGVAPDGHVVMGYFMSALHQIEMISKTLTPTLHVKAFADAYVVRFQRVLRLVKKYNALVIDGGEVPPRMFETYEFARDCSKAFYAVLELNDMRTAINILREMQRNDRVMTVFVGGAVHADNVVNALAKISPLATPYRVTFNYRATVPGLATTPNGDATDKDIEALDEVRASKEFHAEEPEWKSLYGPPPAP